MSYVLDQILIEGTAVTATSSAVGSTDVLATVGGGSTVNSDLVVHIHNPSTSAADLLVGFSKTATTSLTLSRTTGLTAPIPPGATYSAGLRRNAGKIWIAGDLASLSVVVTVASITSVATV
jgi:hypothetical protein